ncbi:hypothetical protein QZH41_012697 [Actinostola sp. cb2023]|nr:hypothetical protein QZH41_012697 [Actinostola sp. cb2023]
MGECMTKICQCHFCRCCECGPGCGCCMCCRKWFGDWWMCSDCCEEQDDDEELIVNNKKPKQRPDEGEGMYQYENGDFYVGEWRRGKRHGYGSLEMKDGTRHVGFFYDDEYVGEKPDERLRRSPVTSRPFAKKFKTDETESEHEGDLRREDLNRIELAKAEEEQSTRNRLLDGTNGQSYDTVQK